MAKPDYDTTLARIAGNIAAGILGGARADGAPVIQRECVDIVPIAVDLARAIVAEVRRTDGATKERET